MLNPIQISTDALAILMTLDEEMIAIGATYWEQNGVRTTHEGLGVWVNPGR